jgi:predicted O-methyltransferase YrrM
MIYPEDVRGWLSRVEAESLHDLAANRRVLEIGSFCGLSTIVLAQSAAEVHAVDPFNCTGLPSGEGQNSEQEFRANLGRYQLLLAKVIVHVGLSADVLPGLSPPFDLVFIDGAHDELNLWRDLAMTLPLLHADSWLAFHDYGHDLYADVQRVVDAWRGARVFRRIDSLAIVQSNR